MCTRATATCLTVQVHGKCTSAGCLVVGKTLGQHSPFPAWQLACTEDASPMSR